MTKYYSVWPKHNPRLAVVTSPRGVDDLDWIGRSRWIKRHDPIGLIVKKRGKLPDLLGNDLLVHLCSPKLRSIIDEYKTAEDRIQWLEATVEDGDVRHQYYILHFPERVQLLNLKKCLLGDEGQVIKPVLDKTLVQNRCVFSDSVDSDLSLCFREDLRRAVDEAGCTGISYEPAPAA